MSTIALSENLFQVSLTQEQSKVVAKRLPPGFGITLFRTSKREATKKIQQDISSEDEPKKTKRIPNEQYKQVSNDEMKKCSVILQKLKKHPSAAPFTRRIDNVYYPHDVEYVDISIVEANLRNGIYQTGSQFWGDVRKIWQMSYTMNSKGSQIYAMTSEIEQFFNELYKEIDQPYLGGQVPPQKVNSGSAIPKRPSQSQAFQQNAKKPAASKSAATIKMETQMNLQEKKALVQNIRNLPPEHLRGVWEIVSDGLKIDQNEELEFDIDNLSVKKTRQLEKYVNTKLQYLKKIQTKRNDDIHPTSEGTDKIVHKANTQYNYTPQPITNDLAGNDTGDSSFSSDDDESG